MFSDFRFALRMLAKQPGFTAVAVLTMAIAIGANTALFSVVNAVVLRPIDYPRPEELVRVWAVNPERGVEFPAVSWPRYLYFRDNATMLQTLSVSVGNAVTISDRGEAEQVPSMMASANFLSTLGLVPQLGRFFTAEEDQPGGPNVAVISHRLWQTRFGGASDVLGATLSLDGVAHIVVGVLPAQMPVPYNQTELFTPRPLEIPFVPPQARDGGAVVWQLTARLKQGVTREAAEKQLIQLNGQLREKHPQLLDADNPVQLRYFSDEIIPAQLRLASWVLVAAVGSVLLIACANIANLALAQLAGRSKEIAVRTSLGAGRRAILQQFLVESGVVAIAGGFLGVLLAIWSLDAIRILVGTQLPRIEKVAIDPATLLFALAATALSAVLVGLYPAWHATRTDVQLILKEAGRGMAGGHSTKHFRSALVVAEVAVSLVLMIGASLLLYSFARLQRTPLGFQADRVATGIVNLPQRDYPTPEKQREFVRLLQEKLSAAPELAAAGVGYGVPLTNSQAVTPYSVGGRPVLPISERQLVGIRQVTDGFFSALGYTLKQGRFIEDTDQAKSTLVCVINDAFAKKLFPDKSAVGEALLFGRTGEVKCEIVGVVNDVKSGGAAAPVPDEVYFAHSQRGNGFFSVVAKANPELSAAAVFPVIRRALHEIDPKVAFANPQTAAELVAQNMQGTRALSLLLGVFAAVAAILAVVGIYGVIAYNVTQRTAEIGVRLALGATTRSIFRLVLRTAGILLGIGLAIGLVVSLAASRVLRQLLYQVEPFDPVVFSAVAVVFAGVGFIAAVIPARRATLVDPLTALRAE